MDQSQFEQLIDVLKDISDNLKDLGLGATSAGTRMGAIELLAKEVKSLASIVSSGIDKI